MAWPSPQGSALTDNEEKLLWDHDVVSKLTEEQWRAFGAYVAAEDPDELDAKHWITSENGLDLNTFKLRVIRVLIKQARFKWHGQPPEDLGDSSDSDSASYVVWRPGSGLPLGHLPDEESRFPLLFLNDKYGDGWKAVTLLIRECCMLKLVDELSDKPEWWRKVEDDEIASKWKAEALKMDWGLYLKYADFTPAMADACIAELRKKAIMYQKTGLIPVYDYSIAVFKSDSIMGADLAESLQKAVKLLEDVPPEQKDWHPNSDDQVLDLVHPSLWPLVYGRSRVLRDRTIGLDDALTECGLGKVLRPPKDEETIRFKMPGSFCERSISVLSNKFQWLPCDVDVDPATGRAKIMSYINNLHPKEHAALYPIIETFIEKSLPAWDIIYRWEKDFAVQRLTVTEVGPECSCPEFCSASKYGECKPWNRPLGPEDEDSDEEPEDEGSESDNDMREDYYYNDDRRKGRDDAWFASTHSAKLPDADPSAEDYVNINDSDIKTNGFFDGTKQVQVIVKLANIHLTPDKPSYPGGSWHTEGQLNEHIVSTALYYYDSDNITDCTLSFRTCANAEDLEAELTYEQNEDFAIDRTFAIQMDGYTLQDIGSVHTKPGRAIFFPNLVQHRVSPFQLADPTKPGHRKILALFLVDPAIPIISTSNVPPQQEHWWPPQTGLQREISEKQPKRAPWPIGLEEAKQLRLRLMKERASLQDQERRDLESVEWNFCEH